MESDSLNRLKELAECSVCRELFTDPRSLPCGHSYCLACLEKTYRHSVFTNVVRCPNCRQDSFLPNSNISDFPKNTVIEGILNILKSELEEQNLCDVCKCSPTRNVCMNCDVRICEKCTGHHKTYSHNSHTLLSFSDIKGTPLLHILSERQKHWNCSIHPGNVTHSYCLSCKEALCEHCTMQHNDCHSLTSFEEEVQSMKKILVSQKTLEPEIETLKETSDTLRKYHETLDSSLIDAKSLMRDAATELRNVIDTKEKECIERIEHLHSRKSKHIQDLLETSDTRLVVLKHLSDYMKALNKYGTELILVKCKQSVMGQLEQVEKQKNEQLDVPNEEEFKLSFSKNTVLLDKMKQSTIGSIYLTTYDSD